MPYTIILMKNKEKNSNENLDKQKYKKRYILRKYEEVEADNEIKQFTDKEELNGKDDNEKPAGFRP